MKHHLFCSVVIFFISLSIGKCEALANRASDTLIIKKDGVQATKKPRKGQIHPAAIGGSKEKEKSAILQFTSVGQLMSFPPESIAPKGPLYARVMLNQHFWEARINDVLGNRIKMLENLKNYGKNNKLITFGINEPQVLKQLKIDLAGELDAYINALPATVISTEQKTYYIKKLRLIGIDITTYQKGTTKYLPVIDALVDPVYSIIYTYFDRKGNRIGNDGKPYCDGDLASDILTSCSGNKYGFIYESAVRKLPDNCAEVKYELRLDNNLNKTVMNWKPEINFPAALQINLDNIKNLLNDKLQQDYKKVGEAVEKLVLNNLDPSVPVHDLEKILRGHNQELQNQIDNLNDGAKKEWIATWLWLNNGIPKVNPFDAKSALFANQGVAPLTAEDRALYQLFDNMVNKGVIKVENIEQLDNKFKNIPRIKAALDAEAAGKAAEPQAYDRLLYQGILKATLPDSMIYMRHIDVLNNYLIMAYNPRPSITERERMYPLAENKGPSLKLSATFTLTADPDDNSWFTHQIGGNQDKGLKTPLKGDQLSRQQAAIYLITNYPLVGAKIAALIGLSQAPVLPVFYEHDDTPDLMTEVLDQNYSKEGSSTVTYTIKQNNPDNTQKDVNTGSFHRDKLDRFRFKAGLVYSFLRKNDFSDVGNGQYTMDNPQFGIDGTFGLQTFFTRQNMRSKEPSVRPFFYAGFSMRKITENFYLGLGVEPLAGLAISCNAHIGKMEALIGTNGVPIAISQRWNTMPSVSILVDGALFVKLFSFGNTNKSLLGL